jgi:hypothetical protein
MVNHLPANYLLDMLSDGYGGTYTYGMCVLFVTPANYYFKSPVASANHLLHQLIDS